MSDSYDAIYNAVRSRISNGNIGDVVEQVARQAFDISHIMPHIRQEIYVISHEWQRPSVLFRPKIMADGDRWIVLLGDDLQVGVSGNGATPAEAMAAFDEAFWKQRTPTAIRLAALSPTPVNTAEK